MARAGDIEQTVAALGDLIEEAIVSFYPETADSTGGELGAARLTEAMRYSLTTPGKRIRPLLTLAVVDVLGGDVPAALPLAVALEQVHAYSLIHDDLPAMDDDDLRRGRPTNHKVFGEGMAILAGDALLTDALVGVLAPVISSSIEPALQMRIAREVAVAAGRDGMVGGQAADLLAQGCEPDENVLRSLHGRKTGRLITASVRAGALFAKAEATQLDALNRFAASFGLAFQIADDIKDVVLPPERTGKIQGGDQAAGKMTYPAHFGIDESRRLCLGELGRAVEALGPLGGKGAVLEYIARDAVAPAFGNGD